MRRAHLLGPSLVLTLALGCQTASTSAPTPTSEDPAELEARRAPAAAFAVFLGAEDAALRARAVVALGRLERVDALPLILKALADPAVTVRHQAAFAAGQLDLALSSPGHDAARATVERALLGRLTAETAPAARVALVRALGQVGATDGQQELLALAGGAGPLRAPALRALGVSGQRRGAALATDVRLRQVITSALADNDPAVVDAAAYAAFRQKVVLDEQSARLALGAPEQTRIHLARAIGHKDTPAATVTAIAGALLKDSDWRVQVEALRAYRAHPEVEVTPILELLPSTTQGIARAGAAHVVTEACATLATVGAPGPSLAAIELAVAGLAAGPTWTQARCTCAGVVEVLGGPGDALEQCLASAGAPTVTQRLLSVDTIARARISTAERAGALKGLLDDASPKVRMAAAQALCADGSEVTADAAATRLVVEEDSGVMSMLLECFAGGAHADVLKDRTLGVVAGRLQGRPGFEAAEPLMTVAGIALGRGTPAMKELVAALATHGDATVRDTARGVAHGDRAPGPRAVVLPSPSVGSLPLAAVLRTTRGEIVIAFERERAPRTVKTFVELVRKGTLDNTPFHRVIPDFVAQGGDPRGDGSGGPGFTIPNENNDATFSRGAVGIAHAGTDTGGSQFFLTHSDQPHLDGRYTLFATVTDGLAVMDNLQRDDVLLSVDLTTALRPRATTSTTSTTTTTSTTP